MTVAARVPHRQLRFTILLAVSLLVVGSMMGSCTKDAPAEESASPANPASTSQVDSSVESFLTGYFQSWSDGDIAAYRDHFHPEANIKFIESGAVIMSVGLTEFIEIQQRIIAEADPPMHEEMTSLEVRTQDDVAWARADYVLTQGTAVTTGVDHFTLMKDAGGNWKIISLLYYETRQ